MSEAGRYSGPEKPSTPSTRSAPTVEVPKQSILEGLIRAMQREQQEGFASLNTELHRVKADVHIVMEDQRIHRERIDMLEKRMGKASGTIRAVKETDEEQIRRLDDATEKNRKLEEELTATRRELQQTKTLATETKALAEATKVLTEKQNVQIAKTQELATDTKALTERQNVELAKQTATLDRIAAFASNPHVKDFARVVATALATWLAMKGLK